jgi:hypothetical protein
LHYYSAVINTEYNLLLQRVYTDMNFVSWLRCSN